MSLTLVAVGTGVAAVSGLAVAPLIGALPEPAPASTTGSTVHDKERYADIARLRRLPLWAVVVAAVAGAILGLSLDRVTDLVLWLPLVPVCVALALIDLRTKLLPVRLVLPATAYVLAAGVVIAVVDRDPDALIRGLIGLVVARSFFWVLWRIYPRGMGFGDVRLAAVLGFALAHAGWAEFAVGMYAGFPLLGVPGLLLALVKRDRAELKRAYPFGPAMVAGALLGVSVGEPLVSALFGT